MTTKHDTEVSLVGMHRTTFHDIWFDDREFRETHGRAPRGFGGWAFEFEGLDMVWAPPMKFSAAKVWIRKYIRNLAPYATGTIRVKVCT